jgi:hypothetical protein
MSGTSACGWTRTSPVGITVMPLPTASSPAARNRSGLSASSWRASTSGWGRSYDVSPDGQRFLMALTRNRLTDLASTQMILVQNWFDELKRLVPVR